MMTQDECEQAASEYRLRVRLTGSSTMKNPNGAVVDVEHLRTRDDAARWAREYGTRLLETVAELRSQLADATKGEAPA